MPEKKCCLSIFPLTSSLSLLITYFLVKFGWLSEQTMGEEPALDKSESPTSLLTGAGAFPTSVFKLHLRKYDVKLKF